MSKVYQIITDKFIDQLKKGVIPWRKPWACTDMPMNLVSKKPYRGVNLLILAMSGFSSPWWLTKNQIESKGGSIKPDQKDTIITFFTVNKDKKDPKKSYMVFRFYKVWNVEQCDNIEVPKTENIDFIENVNAETISANYKDCPEIKHGGNRAFYSPVSDYIQMPNKESFKSPNHYYTTLFHEQIHSTGHHTKLDRLKVGCFDNDRKEYAFEELVAEIGASFLCHEAKIDQTDLFDNSVAYINSWLTKLKNDATLIVSAARHAQIAVEYMKGNQNKESESEVQHEAVNG